MSKHSITLAEANELFEQQLKAVQKASQVQDNIIQVTLAQAIEIAAATELHEMTNNRNQFAVKLMDALHTCIRVCRTTRARRARITIEVVDK